MTAFPRIPAPFFPQLRPTMKIRAKSLFRSLVFLLVLAYAAAHVLVRTEFGRRHARGAEQGPA